MAQLEELRIRFQDDVSAGANAAAAALTKVGQAADGATEQMRQTDEVVKRVGTSAEQLARKYIEAERATALREQSERRHARALADVAAAEQAGSVTAERAAQIRTEIARRAELDAARIVAASERRQQAEARALGGGIGLNGTTSVAAAEAQLNRLAIANDNATRSGSRLSGVMGQAGFQIQDFTTQVAMGQNAVTAFGVQGAQLLGAFGPQGIIAGAVLMVGTLAYQLFSTRSATDELKDAQDRLAASMRTANDFFDTQTERAERLDRQNRSTVASTLAQEAATLRVTQARRAERVAELESTMEQVRLARGLGGDDTQLPENIRRRAAEYERLNGELGITAQRLQAIDELMERARGGQSGVQRDEQSREARQQAEEARREAERRARQGEQEAQRRARQDEQEAQRRTRAEEQETARREREAREALERVARDEQRANEERERANRETTNDIVRYGADRFADLFDRNGQGWKGLMRTFETTARQTFARIAAEAIIRPIIAPIVSGLGLGGLTGASADGASGGGLSSLLSGAGMLGNASSLFSSGAEYLGLGGLGGVSGLLAAPVFGTGALTSATTSALSGMGAGVYGPATASAVGLPGVSLGGALAGIGGGFALGSMAGGLLAGRSQARQQNAQIGAGLGAIGGFIIGGPVGGIVGGTLGGAGGGIIGPGPKTNAYGYTLDAADGRLSAGNLRTTGNGNGGDEALAEARAASERINAFLQANAITVENNSRVVNGWANSQDQSATFGDAFKLLRFRSSTDPTLQRVLDRGFESPDELAGAVQWATGVYDALSGIAKPTDQWAQQIKALNDNFTAAIDKAKEYGLATEGLVANQAKAVAQVNAQRENTILGALVGQSRILTGFLESRLTSTGSAQSQFGAAQAGYQSALSAARTAGQGSADLNAVVTAANTLLSANSSFYGSGAQAAAIESMVRSQITALGGQLDLPGFTTDITGAISRANDLQLDQLKLLNDGNAALKEEIRGLRLVIERSQAA